MRERETGRGKERGREEESKGRTEGEREEGREFMKKEKREIFTMCQRKHFHY